MNDILSIKYLLEVSQYPRYSQEKLKILATKSATAATLSDILHTKDQENIKNLISTDDLRRKKVGFMLPSEKPNWMDKNAGRVDKAVKGVVGGATVVGTGVIGNEIRKSNNEKTDIENAQVAAHNKALAAHAAAQVVPPTEPPKSFVQQYGDQAKAMWDKAVADGTAKWGEFNTASPNAGKYGAAGLVALGAGIGAVALAKKLRAKKAAVKK